MQFYFQVPRLCAMHCHLSSVYGARPFFRVYKISSEVILHIPYCEIIFTPYSKLLIEKKILKDYEEKLNS